MTALTAALILPTSFSNEERITFGRCLSGLVVKGVNEWQKLPGCGFTVCEAEILLVIGLITLNYNAHKRAYRGYPNYNFRHAEDSNSASVGSLQDGENNA